MSESGRKFSFEMKVLAVVLVSSIGLTLVTSLIFVKQYIGSYHTFIDSYKKSLYNDFDTQAKSEVETAVSMLQRINERHQSGEMSLEKAKELGADLLRNLKFGKDGYFWADTTDGVSVVMLGKSSEGKSRIDLQDTKGKYIIREIIENGKKPGGGFTDYWFPKAGSDLPLQRGYSLEFKPFGWVIGTGNYVDDLDALVKGQTKIGSI